MTLAPTIIDVTDRPQLGGNKPALHRERAYKLLADGEWHDYHRILSAVTAVVNPSQAWRHAIKHRKTPPPTDPELRAKLIRTGQRSIARSALGRTERFERRVKGDVQQIRLKPWIIRTPEQRSATVRKGHAKRSAEQKSTAGKKGWATRRQR